MSNAPVPPQNLDAEESVLGAMMLAPRACEAVREVLGDGEAFYRASHRDIYQAATALHGRGEPVDAITVVAELTETGKLDKAGGADRVNELAAIVPASANAGHYARLVIEAAQRRELIDAGGRITRLGWEGIGEPADLVTEARALTENLSEAVTGDLPLSWRAVSLLDIAGDPPRAPDKLSGTIYSDSSGILSGEPGTGKSMVAMALIAEEAMAGRRSLYLDLERTPALLLERLKLAGLTDKQIGLIDYVRPTETATPAQLADLVAPIDGVVVVDSYDAALGLFAPEARNEDVQRFAREFLDPLRSSGATVVLIDHVTKNKETRGNYSIGAQRKLAVADWHLRLEVAEGLQRGHVGKLRIKRAKDNLGFLPRNVGTFELTSHEHTGALSWEVAAGTDQAEGDWKPTGLMEKVSRYVESCIEPPSRAEIEAAVTGKRDYIRQAIIALVAEDYMDENQDGRGYRYSSVRIYREDAADAA